MEEPENKNKAALSSYSIGNIGNIDAYTQAASRAILQSIRSGHGLPASGDDYDYYSSFESFRAFMDIESSRILQIIQQVMRWHGARGNLTTSGAAHEIEDKFDVLVDANDQILERAGTFIDEASGIKKETPLIVATATKKQATPQGSWNKKGRAAASSKGFSFRLLSAKNIQRPQLAFKDKVDNSYRPFIPKVHEKPNALKSISEVMSAQIEQESQAKIGDDNIQYPHPYHFELEQFQPSEDQLTKRTPQLAKPIEDTPLTLVSTPATLTQLMTSLRGCRELAVDVEHHSYRSYLGLTCLLQLSTRNEDFLVDALALRDELHVLNEIFTDPAVVKVFHGADCDVDCLQRDLGLYVVNMFDTGQAARVLGLTRFSQVFHGADCDVEWLQRDLGLYVVNMFDTGQAARVLGLTRFSLAHLMQQYCGIDPDKQFQLADWRIRPLPEELIKYAREDTHYLLYIYDRLHSELLTRGNAQSNLLQSVIQRSAQICAKRYEKPVLNDDVHKDLYRKSKKVFHSQQHHALRKLYAWRDRVARTEDESTGYVLPNHMLLQISEVLPRDAPGVLACCNPIPPLVRQHATDILAIVQEAKKIPMQKVETTRTSLKPTRLEHPRYSVNALLHSPHDFSHPRPHISLPTGVEDLSDLTSKTSKLFGTNKPTSKTGRDTSQQSKPSSLFACLTKQPESRVVRKVSDILASFTHPLHQFLPLRLTEGEEIQTSETMIMSEDQQEAAWRLKPHTVRNGPTNETEQDGDAKLPPQPLIPGDTVTFSLLDIERERQSMLPLRAQLQNKRAQKRSGEAGTATDTTPDKATDAKGGSSVGSTENKQEEPNAKRSKPTQSAEATRKRPTVAELQQTGFQPHDYNQTDYSKLLSDSRGRGRGRDRGGRGRGGGSGGGRYYVNEPREGDYNPIQRETTSQHRGIAGPRMAGVNRSMSYKRGQGASRPQIHWPKR